jgi:hypothetical protein
VNRIGGHFAAPVRLGARAASVAVDGAKGAEIWVVVTEGKMVLEAATMTVTNVDGSYGCRPCRQRGFGPADMTVR